MVKSTPEERLGALVRAATIVFVEKGYRRTQMSDVAAELGVSAGNLYNYVESKDALFHRCLLVSSPARRPAGMSSAFPLPTPPAGAIADVVAAGTRELRRPGSLRTALTVPDPVDVATELASIIGEMFDRTRASRAFQALVERSAPDFPELFESFYVRTRRPTLLALTTYLELRIASGHLRPVPDTAAAARLVNETQAWFARHRRGDHDPDGFTNEIARATVIDLLTAALLPR